MATKILPHIGIQLLLIQISQSFVLLTANIDDVKKLAMKFVPEKMANKISTFIKQIAKQMAKDQSKEYHTDVSKENKEYSPKLDSVENDYFINKDKYTDLNLRSQRKDAEIFSHLEGTSKYVPESLNLKKDKNVDSNPEDAMKSVKQSRAKLTSADATENKVDDNDSIVKDTNVDAKDADVNVNNKSDEFQLIATSGDVKLTRGITDDDMKYDDNKKPSRQKFWF